MVALPQQFNTADLPDTGGKTVLIPQGQYQAVIVESELKPTSKGDGQYLAMKIVITQGQYAHTEFTERLNIINPNQVAVEIAYKTLARISEALGMQRTPLDSNELHNRPLMIQVETEAGKPYTDNDGVEREGKDKSVIKKYLPMPATGQSANTFAPPQQAALPQTQTATATAPVSNPFAAPQG